MESTQSLSAVPAPSAALSPEKRVLAWYDAWADDMLRFCFLCLGSQQEATVPAVSLHRLQKIPPPLQTVLSGR